MAEMRGSGGTASQALPKHFPGTLPAPTLLAKPPRAPGPCPAFQLLLAPLETAKEELRGHGSQVSLSHPGERPAGCWGQTGTWRHSRTARHGSGRGRDARPGRQMAPGTRRELREEGAEEGDARRGGVRGGLSGLTGEDVCGCGVGAIHLFRAITSHPSITIREKSLPRLPLQLRWGGPSPATGINLERAALSSRAGPTCRAASPRHSSPNCHWSGLPSSVQKDKRYIRCESYLLQWDVLLQHG